MRHLSSPDQLERGQDHFLESRYLPDNWTIRKFLGGGVSKKFCVPVINMGPNHPHTTLKQQAAPCNLLSIQTIYRTRMGEKELPQRLTPSLPQMKLRTVLVTFIVDYVVVAIMHLPYRFLVGLRGDHRLACDTSFLGFRETSLGFDRKPQPQSNERPAYESEKYPPGWT